MEGEDGFCRGRGGASMVAEGKGGVVVKRIHLGHT
jgi:hypothetical protein